MPLVQSPSGGNTRLAAAYLQRQEEEGGTSALVGGGDGLVIIGTPAPEERDTGELPTAEHLRQREASSFIKYRTESQHTLPSPHFCASFRIPALLGAN